MKDAANLKVLGYMFYAMYFFVKRVWVQGKSRDLTNGVV